MLTAEYRLTTDARLGCGWSHGSDSEKSHKDICFISHMGPLIVKE